MSRNIIVFSDGTGQRGGVMFDENRSNIYKLFRATRVGPESSVNPSRQLAFYDPGIGTEPLDANFGFRQYRRVHNLVSQATGLGLTLNMIECYAAIIRLWRPGDQIFLFGFSRGAYTVRALGGVLGFCGVPTRMADGSPLRRDEKTTLAIAREAVKDVYQFTSSRKPEYATPEQSKRIAQRELIADRFRQRYGSDLDGRSNTVAHFIGVFDTVAAVGNPIAVAILSLLTLAALVAAAWLLSLLVLSFVTWLIVLAAAASVVVAVLYVRNHRKSPGPLPGYTARETTHWTEFRMRFYDFRISPRVAYARHAISVDENRAEFDRVRWGTVNDPEERDAQGVKRFEQAWFAGNHSDVGGSYPENDSRLSDTALQWMLDAAISAGLAYDPTWLHLFQDAAGPQHDERRRGLFRFTPPFVRKVNPTALLHQSVLDRFELPEVLQFDVLAPYRPEALRSHGKLAKYYETG